MKQSTPTKQNIPQQNRTSFKTSKVEIKISNLVKNFGNKEVLKGVDLEIFQGESIVIIGASGCGKTVLIKILASLLEATSGSVKINGEEIVGRKAGTKPSYEISFLFQLNALFDSYPIWKNICLAKIENEGIGREDAIAIAKERLKDVDLTPETAFLYPSDISGGMQKRVALARCLTSNPDIIFFDEPTTGLDPLTSLKISNLIRGVGANSAKKITKISIMHDIECAKIVADRIIFLQEGKVEWAGTPTEMETTTNEDLITFIRRKGVM